MNFEEATQFVLAHPTALLHALSLQEFLIEFRDGSEMTNQQLHDALTIVMFTLSERIKV